VATDGPSPVEPRPASVIPVLIYHSVADLPAAGQERFTVTPASFAQHVEPIVSSGAVALTISELARALRGERPLPERAIAVTFDDGFADTLAAVELLAAGGLTATVYVTTERIDAKDGLPLAMMHEIAGAGAEIGAHTVTHPYLDELAPDVAAHEIRDSKEILEHHLGRTVASFAYPHGAHGTAVRDAVVDAGFDSAVAVKNAFSHPGDDPFAIARLTVMGNTPTERVRDFVHGRGAPLAWEGERLRTRAFRDARRLRRRLRRTDTRGAAA
jgi:peptidoglycan/xylan/chitin deacetylase (PgdA/CDA1 family)